MIKYIVYTKGKALRIGRYDSPEEAQKAALDFINKSNKDINSIVPPMTIFDLSFDTEEIPNVPKVLIPNYLIACKYLKVDPVDLDFVLGDGDSKILEAACAFYQLNIIAKAWNKVSNFNINFNDEHQLKYYPLFEYSDEEKKFKFTSTRSAITIILTRIGNNLCFKNRDIAADFGIMFQDLYNQIMLV